MTKDRYFRGEEIKIHLRPNVTGVRICATLKRIPLHWKEKADKLVASMLQSDVIERVTKPTVWCSSGKFVEKPGGGGLRLVQDFVALNKNVRRPAEPTNSAADIHKQILPSSKFFAAIDLSSGYWQVKLGRESRDLAMFILPQGRFRMKRAPMGLCSSSDEFLISMEAIFGKYPWLLRLIDDLLIQGKTKQQVLRRLRAVLKTCRKYGVTLKRSKIQIRESVDFVGFKVESGEEGVVIVPDPKKVKGIIIYQIPNQFYQCF
jgi:hypothetical protein